MLLAAQRKEKIAAMIREDGHAKVAALSKLFNVTEVTIRQDLEKLEDEGICQRVHGGAILAGAGANVGELKTLNQDNLAAKRAIARQAVALIRDGETIILDSGSTTTEIARLINGYTNLTVITNAINIAMILGKDPGINLNVTGGEFKSPTLSLTGPKAAEYFNGLHADKVFLATAGISVTSGLTYPSMSDLVVKQAMIDVSDHVYLVADSTKVGRSSFATLGQLTLVDTIITDSNLSDADRELFRRYNLPCIIAPL